MLTTIGTIQKSPPPGADTFSQMNDPVSSYDNSVFSTPDAVQKEIDALNNAFQGMDFSNLANDALQQTDQTAQAGATGTADAPAAPAQPNLTDGSAKLSSVDPDSVPVPSADDKRPPGDDRTAQQIMDDNPLLKNLGNQSGVRDMLKKQCGDIDHDPDAAYRATEVLNYVKTSKESDGTTTRSADLVDNGKIEGFTHDGDARHGTEAGMLQDFGKEGYGFLKGTNHCLATTTDSHVRKDGTNMSNAQWVGHQILHGLSEAFQWMAKITEKVLGKIPGIGKLISGVADAVDTAISGALNIADTALQHGNIGKAAKDLGADMVGAVVGFVDPTGLAANAADQAVRNKIGG